MSDPDVAAIIAAYESAEGNPAAQAAATQDAIARAFAAADRQRAHEAPLRQAWLRACVVPGLPPHHIDDSQFSYSVRGLAARPLVAQTIAAIPESLPALPRAERFRPAEELGKPARLREALLADGEVRLDVGLAGFTRDGSPDFGSEGRLLPTWHLSWPEEDAFWTYGVDWDDFNGWTNGILEVEAGVVFADAGDSSWFQIGFDSPRPADEVLALFLRAVLAAYRRAGGAAGIN